MRVGIVVPDEQARPAVVMVAICMIVSRGCNYGSWATGSGMDSAAHVNIETSV